MVHMCFSAASRFIDILTRHGNVNILAFVVSHWQRFYSLEEGVTLLIKRVQHREKESYRIL